MSEIAATAGRSRWRATPGPAAETTWRTRDARRVFQLVLAGIWLLDGLLQYQSSMFNKAFGQMLAATASGNPGVISGPINWDARLVGQHDVALNAIFATVQLLLGLGIAWRRTVRITLAVSVAWSLGVWWFGEGLGGILSGSADPVNGAPGAVLLYALLAVLLWPADRSGAPAPFTAARAVGTQAARALWFVLWASFAYFALLPANRAPQALHDIIAPMGIASIATGEPGWLAGIDKNAAALVANQGLAASIVLAIALALIAVGVYLPAPAARAALVLAIVVAAVIWVVGEALGGMLVGGATDPNSGPLLALLALAYWPVRTMAASPPPPACHSLAGGEEEGVTA